jgi:hypothetical protein
MPFDLQEILKLETRVWEALMRGDAALDRAMLSEDFLGIYPTGFATREEHCAPLKDGPTVADYKIIDPKLIELGPGLVLLGYLAQWVRIKNGQPQDAEQMYISSIWRQSNTGWKNIFSQDTPVAG